ncbi:uncharacterized protein V6R79_023157 [Siganus canaliculatus]
MQTEKKDLTTVESHPKPQGLSLPIDDRTWIQQKLRDERNKEYKLFLQKQAQTGTLKRRTLVNISTPGQSQAPNDGCISFLNVHSNTSRPPRERPASRKDAATLTEAARDGKRTDTWESGQQRWRRRRWQLPRLHESFSSEEELVSDREVELEFRPRRRRVRQILHGRRAREPNDNRKPEDTKEGDAPVPHDQNNNKWVEKLNTHSAERMRTAVRSQSAARKDEAEFATGLIIGVREEQKSCQMKKEQYRQELLKQIAEQRRNKIRERELEMRAIASGATDPEKQPDRMKLFGARNQQRNSKRQNVPQKSGVDLDVPVKNSNPRPLDDKVREDKDLGTLQDLGLGECHTDLSPALGQTAPRPVQSVSLLAGFNEDYHRDFSNMLGEVAMPRVSAAPPSVPASVPNSYKTPYDEAYYYYGARNPLVHDLSHNQPALPEGVKHSRNPHSPPPRPAPLRASGCAQASDQHGWTPLTVGELSDNVKERREKAARYQEALRQQIEEREQLKRRQREEKERYDAKIEAEMMAYNPWGRSGGGASIKDQNGNLVSDLNQMHRINEMLKSNPRQMQSLLKSSDHTPEDEARPPLSQLPGHGDEETTQKPHMNNKLKELQQQMEEKKQRQEEERERLRIEEEREEKRLTEQRARMLREYEKDQEKRKPKQKGISILEPIVQHVEVKKKVRQKQEVEKKVLQSSKDQEEKRDRLSYKREPSPPIPTLQRKQTDLIPSRPSSVGSHLSSRTERSASAPHRQPTPVKTAQQEDGRQEVMRELSALRRYLRKEQKQLEVQLRQTDQQENPLSLPSRPRGRARAARSLPRMPPANVQTIQEFNQLKYRDTASREEVRHMFPDPPTDEQSLDVQQQALLREQQRHIRFLRREEEPDFTERQLSHRDSRNSFRRHVHRDSMLPSETTFIDHRQRTATPRNTRDCNGQSMLSATDLNLEPTESAHKQHYVKRQGTGDLSSRSAPPDDEVDRSSLRSALERRVSVDTVATEPWLRPGTSEAVKESGSTEMLHPG